MVADAVIYHPAVAHFNRFVATTIGRDKLLRTIQYFSRFLAWYLYRTNRPQKTVDTCAALKTNFAAVRKALRLGKFVEHLKAAAVASDSVSKSSSGDKVLKYLAVGRQLGYAGYMLLDNVTYLDFSGVRKWEGAKRVQREAYKFWVAGLACNVAAGLYTLYGMQAQRRQQAKGADDGEKTVQLKTLDKDRVATQLQLFSDLCDLTVPTANLGLINFDDGIVGLAGTTSSLIGLGAAWTKTG